MAFRFRKSFGFGFGRVNLSKRGLSSVSLGGPGNVVSLGRQGVRRTVGIPGTGMSWSYKLFGGSGKRRSKSYHGNDALREYDESSERLDADLAVQEAECRAMELQLAKCEALESQMTPEEAADFAIAQAKVQRARVNLDQSYRTKRRIEAEVRNARAAVVLKWILIVAVACWVMSHFGARAAEAQSSSRSFYGPNGSFARELAYIRQSDELLWPAS